jgi:hypothetical protein
MTGVLYPTLRWALWHTLARRTQACHKGAQTFSGPSRSPSRSMKTARPVGRASALGRRFRVSGSQTNLLTHTQRVLYQFPTAVIKRVAPSLGLRKDAKNFINFSSCLKKIEKKTISVHVQMSRSLQISPKSVMFPM